MTRPLPKRQPGQALHEIVPEDPGPSQVNLFGVAAGESVASPSGVGRLRLLRSGQDDPEPAA